MGLYNIRSRVIRSKISVQTNDSRDQQRDGCMVIHPLPDLSKHTFVPERYVIFDFVFVVSMIPINIYLN